MTKEISRRIEVEKQLNEANDQVHKSIEFSSMIQRALIPDKESFEDFFSQSFTIWKPRDIVGGDIYFFEELRHKDEAILMVVDCTGHGVPGAFVTMLVKAIERNVTGYIKKSDEEVSPAKLLSVLNGSMKHLLKQHDKTAESNAGFDAGILYINKRENIARYAGAEIDLYYTKEGNVQRLKGDRQSIGYRTSKIDYVFQDTEIPLEKKMQFYITTDGYLDQNGGNKGFPLGKRRFKNILDENIEVNMPTMETILMQSLQDYQAEYEANDDVTIVGVQL
jgi:serine phosphatase RsbU (regulator of sigma subunit)